MLFRSAPRKPLILLVAIVVGFAIPAVIIYLLENMNTKLRGRKDLDKVNVPFLGEIPLYATGKKASKSIFFKKKKEKEDGLKTLVVEEGNRDVINEAFRVLRSNMDFMAGSDKNKNVLVMTSFNPGSGKSFLTMNIAASFAIKNKKILVIDGDLRHGSTSSYVNSPSKGLSEYLSNRTDNWKDLIVKYGKMDNLHIMPIGPVPPNPTELLENGKLGKLIEELRPLYDYIFIDCPPIDIVADTQIIEK